ncbi:hypothetical protein C1H76_3580 [Elsinoe australis]|uniref:TRIP4/RQT4 C2HC5-type zinc finger domain-containing protein n=1 Tax=Elsinoe australis TaxID=40998 RepID=A0A4U7B0D6_9PEZI|nr:hypothetical protein C1H76_3580 [Elsinoe australis]
MASDLLTWALPRIERLLPIDQDSLKEVLNYADSLPKDAAAEHLKNLLGDSAQSLEFISSFNQRRRNAPMQSNSAPSSKPSSRQPSPPADGGVPRARSRQQKPKKNIHALPARQIEDRGNYGGAYVKKDEEDYMAGSSKHSKVKDNSLASALSLASTPDISPEPPTTNAGVPSIISASASLQPSPAMTPKSSRTSSPAPSKSSPNKANQTKTKVTLVGGKAMHGASTALSDLDSAIRTLELQTNPLLSSNSAEDLAKRQCNCMATQHPLLSMAPNCLNCGKVICVKQGLGPCTSCNSPLLSADELHSILRVLKDERGKERQTANNATHKRAEVAAKPKPFSGRDFLSASASTSISPSPLASTHATPSTSRDASPGPTPSLLSSSKQDAGLLAAKDHRDKLLAFQSQNARRTQIHDEAADYSMPVMSADGSGTLRGNIWASPAERAMELKKQQRIMREMEFNARPEWERRKVVGSIDVSTGKVVKRFVRDEFEDQEDVGVSVGGAAEDGGELGGMAVERAEGERGKGAFSRNPLLGKMIRPVWKAEGEEVGETREAGGEVAQKKKSTWRRVQDDLDDNEDVILDGGAKGYPRDITVA